MKLKYITLIVLMFILCGCSNDNAIERYPKPADYKRGFLDKVPELKNEYEGGTYDCRSYDLSNLDMSNQNEILQLIDFDTKTVWPSKLSKEFAPSDVMETGKNPGLGIRSLHKEGITGKGVSIAIIDQPLLIDHQEYSGKIKTYEEYNLKSKNSEMHGPAVTAILAGNTVGVAPDVNIYYIAMYPGKFFFKEFKFDLNYMTESILKVVELNKTLKEDEKIRLISISLGWREENDGYDELIQAIETAKEDNIFVISASLEESYEIAISGLGRNIYKDPDDFDSYTPGLYWQDIYEEDKDKYKDRILIPMDSRSTASPTGNNDYVFYNSGGISWTVPYYAGVYALACQVDQNITAEKFIELTKETSKEVDLNKEDNIVFMNMIIDPVALINRIIEDK